MASWYAEQALYYANPEPVANPAQQWGHYSQMVWRDTQVKSAGVVCDDCRVISVLVRR